MTSRKARKKRRQINPSSTLPKRSTVSSQASGVVVTDNVSVSSSQSEDIGSKEGAANYGYVHKDLATIAVVAVLTFAFVLAMALVI